MSVHSRFSDGEFTPSVKSPQEPIPHPLLRMSAFMMSDEEFDSLSYHRAVYLNAKRDYPDERRIYSREYAACLDRLILALREETGVDESLSLRIEKETGPGLTLSFIRAYTAKASQYLSIIQDYVRNQKPLTIVQNFG